jgi:hypothetical protein
MSYSLIYNDEYNLSTAPLYLLWVCLFVPAFLNRPRGAVEGIHPQLARIGVEYKLITLPLLITQIAEKRTLKCSKLYKLLCLLWYAP